MSGSCLIHPSGCHMLQNESTAARKCSLRSQPSPSEITYYQSGLHLLQDTELRGEDEGTSTSGRDSRPPMTFDELLSTTQVGSALNHVAVA